jgi:acid phosphatase
VLGTPAVPGFGTVGWIAALLVCVLPLLHCGGAAGPTANSVPGQPAPPAAALSASPVVIVLEENMSYEHVIGSASMPYLNSLAQQYASASNYFADGHQSLRDYFMLTAGQLFGSDNFQGVFSDDNVVRILTAAGRSWKTYQESIPQTGYLGDSLPPYDKDHNPFAYFTDVLNDPALQARIVPFTQFPADLAANSLPDYSFVAPDLYNDAHSCPGGRPSCRLEDKLKAADDWLKANIAPLFNNSQFSSNGLLIVIFDEGDLTDMRFGGGHVALVIAGPHAKRGFVSNTFYQHPSLLRFTLNLLGISQYPGAAATAPDMNEVLQ